MEPIPTSFDPIPISFFVQLLIATIVLFSVIVVLVLVVIPITCCTTTVHRQVKLILVVFLGVVSSVLWFISINGIVGGYLDDLITLSDTIFTTIDTVKTNMHSVESCLGNFTDKIDLSVITDVETEFNKHKSTVTKWHGIAETSLLVTYSLLGTGTLLFPFLVYKKYRISSIIMTVLFSFFLFVIFIAMIPLSNAGNSGLSYVCGSDIDAHNTKIKELIMHFDGSVTLEGFCDHSQWQYVCDVQTCNEGDALLDNFFNITELQQANLTGSLLNGCDYNHVESIIVTTLEDTIGCSAVRGYYEKMVDGILCTEFYNLFVFTLWPVGLGTIFTILLFTVGFLTETDYVSVASEIVI
jgi:hypothetical protein